MAAPAAPPVPPSPVTSSSCSGVSVFTPSAPFPPLDVVPLPPSLLLPPSPPAAALPPPPPPPPWAPPFSAPFPPAPPAVLVPLLPALPLASTVSISCSDICHTWLRGELSVCAFGTPPVVPVVLALTYLLEPTPLPTTSGSPSRLVPTTDPLLLNLNSSLIDATSNVKEGAPPPPS